MYCDKSLLQCSRFILPILFVIFQTVFMEESNIRGKSLPFTWTSTFDDPNVHVHTLNNSINDDLTKVQELDLELWSAPYDMQKNYRYYLAGHDNENRPLWIWEFGQWNFRKIVEHGTESMELFEMYMDQFTYRMQKSMENRTKLTSNDAVNQITLLCDLEGFSFSQLTHLPTVNFLVRFAIKRLDFLSKHLDLAIVINTNDAANSFINLVEPVVGDLLKRVEIYGTERSTWQPQLLEHIPSSQLPEWYGGTQNFRPISVYG